MSNDRFKFRIAVFERYNTDEWEFTKFIKNTDKFGVSTNGNVIQDIQENVQGYIIHLTREKTPKNVYRTMEVMQSTGLKDKNGKLIYEGDIVQTTFGDNSKIIFYVIWNNENALFNGKIIKKGKTNAFCINEDYLYYLLANGIDEKTEVIGNIYENKNLLERIYNEKNSINF